MLGTFLSLTFYFQGTLHYSAMKSGFAFVPFSVGIIAGATLASRLLPRFGPRAVLTSGLVLGAVGLAIFSFISVHSSYLSHVFPAELIVSLGMGLSFVVLSSTALLGVEAEDAGVASALVNATQQTGGSLGAALINTIAATATASYLAAHGSSLTSQAAGAVHGYTTAFTFSAIVLTAAAILAFALIRAPATPTPRRPAPRMRRRSRSRSPSEASAPPVRFGMVPVGQERPQRGEQDEGLVEHGVVPGLGDLDHWCDPTQPLVHGRTDVGCDQPVLGAEQGQATRDVLEVRRRDGAHPGSELLEDPAIELPLPAPGDLLEGVAGHEVNDVVQVVLLGGHRPEMSDGVVEIGVRARSAEGLAEVVRADLRVELRHRRVAHDDAVDPIPVARRGGNGDESSHAVADDDGQSIDLGRLGHRHDLVGPLVQGVGVAVATVPMARQIDRHHPEFGGEGGRHMGPPMGVGAPTVHEDQSAPVRFAPGQRADGTAVDLHLFLAERNGQGPIKPTRRVRESRGTPGHAWATA